MKKYLITWGMMVLAVWSLSGCRHHMRMYSENKPRVDQELPPGSDESGRKKTRKVYYLEVTKDSPDAVKTEMEPTKDVSVSSGSDEADVTPAEERASREDRLSYSLDDTREETKTFDSMNFASKESKK